METVAGTPRPAAMIAALANPRRLPARVAGTGALRYRSAHALPDFRPAITPHPQGGGVNAERKGVLLVVLAAIVWSFAGLVARYISVTDSWTIVFWRSVFAAATILAVMLVRDGPVATARLFRVMGMPGAVVGLCFGVASIAFVLALGHTTVANILLFQAGIPLIAALMAWIALGERIAPGTWLAIAAVIAGMGIMVSDAVGGRGSPLGNALAMLMTVTFALTIIITRRHPEVRMMPAVCAGTLIAATVSAAMSVESAGALAVGARDALLLFAFGALNLGLGTALFVTGARRIPAALAALLSTIEPALGPVWVWLAHDEVPAARTLAGGAIVFTALFGHLAWQFRYQARLPRPG
jgi:drug/metabolite transporter (DMT)-like permease